MFENVHSSSVPTALKLEITKMSINSGMGKKDVVHTHNVVLLSQKKRERNRSFAEIRMDRETVI